MGLGYSHDRTDGDSYEQNSKIVHVEKSDITSQQLLRLILDELRILNKHAHGEFPTPPLPPPTPKRKFAW